MGKINSLKPFVWLFLLALGLRGPSAKGQILYGSSAAQDSVWAIDTTNWSIAARMRPTLAGSTITALNGLAWDPVAHDTYILVTVIGNSNSLLGKIDLQTAVISQVGSLGNKFASINFRSDGQLFGITDDAAPSNPETLYMINKVSGAATLALALGNGGNGEILSYNPMDNAFYHWSGNAPVVLEKFPAATPYTPVTAISTTGISGGETTGAIALGNGNFIVANTSHQLKHIGTNGTYGAVSMTTPGDLRGLVMPPMFSVIDDTVCEGEPVSWLLQNPTFAHDTVLYEWGDGTTTIAFPAAGASHAYATAGTFVTRAILKNPAIAADTVATASVRVFNMPGVTILPGTNATFCDLDSLLLTGAFGGTLQWYRNGLPIPGANASTYTATITGWYNQTKINTNGCKDSAAVGVALMFGGYPDVDLGPDQTACEGDTLCFSLTNPANVTYAWSGGATTATACFAPTGNLQVLVVATDSVGCAATDTLSVEVGLRPGPAVSIDSSNCPTYVFQANDTTGTSWSWAFGDGGTGTGSTVSHTYLANGTYGTSLIASNACAADTSTGSITVDCIVGVQGARNPQVTFAPNPSNGTFLLQLRLPSAANLHYHLTDIHGRKQMEWKSDDLRSQWSEWVVFRGAPGIYFLNITAGAQRSVHQIVVQ